MKAIFLFYLLLVSAALQAQDIPNPNELVIDQILCEGNASTSCELIQKEIYLNPGDKVNEEELTNAKIRLQIRNLFKSVSIFIRKSSIRGHVDVVVDVVEANPFFVEIGYDYSHGNNFFTEDRNVTLGNRNVFGLGKVFQFRYDGPNYSWEDVKHYETSVAYVDPNLFGSKKFFLNLGASFNRVLSRPMETEWKTGYFDKEDTYSATVGYRIFDFSFLSISQTKTTSFYKQQIYDPEVNTIGLENQLSNTITKVFSYGWNSEDDSNFATVGSRFMLSFVDESNETNSGFNIPGRNYQKVFFKRNWTLLANHFLSTSIDIYNYPDNLQSQTDIVYNYQLNDRINGQGSRSRLFFEVTPVANYYNSAVNFRAGWQAEFAGFGLLKLSLNRWESL